MAGFISITKEGSVWSLIDILHMQLFPRQQHSSPGPAKRHMTQQVAFGFLPTRVVGQTGMLKFGISGIYNKHNTNIESSAYEALH